MPQSLWLEIPCLVAVIDFLIRIAKIPELFVFAGAKSGRPSASPIDLIPSDHIILVRPVIITGRFLPFFQCSLVIKASVLCAQIVTAKIAYPIMRNTFFILSFKTYFPSSPLLVDLPAINLQVPAF